MEGPATPVPNSPIAWDGSDADEMGLLALLVPVSGTPPSRKIDPVEGTSSRSVGSAGGSGSIAVTTGVACTWTAITDVNWVTITSGSSGTQSPIHANFVTRSAHSCRTSLQVIREFGA